MIVDAKGMLPNERNDDETLMVRNMVTPKDAYEALRMEPHMQPCRNPDLPTYGQAMKLVEAWREIRKVRRHRLAPTQCFCRGKVGPLWVPCAAPVNDQVEDLLGWIESGSHISSTRTWSGGRIFSFSWVLV